jgi:hypothetical protein
MGSSEEIYGTQLLVGHLPVFSKHHSPFTTRRLSMELNGKQRIRIRNPLDFENQ